MDKNQVKGNIILSINGLDIPWDNISKKNQEEVANQLSNNLKLALSHLNDNGYTPFQ